jgi:hypothetical protein
MSSRVILNCTPEDMREECDIQRKRQQESETRVSVYKTSLLGSGRR